MYDEAGIPAEHAMILVFAFHREARVAALARAGKVAAKIPATRALAEVPAEGALIAELRAGHGRCGLGQNRETFCDVLVGRDLGDGGHGADAQTAAAAGRRNTPQRRDRGE